MTVGTQTMGGSRSYESDYAIDMAFRKACYDMKIFSLDERVKKLAILLRIGGLFGEFEGDPVENIVFGRNRCFISVDYLYAGSLRPIKDYEQLSKVVISRIDSTPAVLHALCTKRKVKLNLPLMTQEFSVLKELYLKYLYSEVHFHEFKHLLMSQNRTLATGEPVYY